MVIGGGPWAAGKRRELPSSTATEWRFSPHRAGVLSSGNLPATAAYAEPYPRRVRALRHGEFVLDSERGWMLHTPGRPPALWFPAADINVTALPETALSDFPVGQGSTPA